MTKFGTLHEDGTLTNVREISQESIGKCPHFIFVVGHYRDDESCRCDDPVYRAMMIKDWGYRESDFRGIPLRDIIA